MPPNEKHTQTQTQRRIFFSSTELCKEKKGKNKTAEEEEGRRNRAGEGG
jgi:hypothetical protein